MEHSETAALSSGMQKSRYLRIRHERSPEHILILLKSAFKRLSRTIDGTQERKRGNGPGSRPRPSG